MLPGARRASRPAMETPKMQDNSRPKALFGPPARAGREGRSTVKYGESTVAAAATPDGRVDGSSR